MKPARRVIWLFYLFQTSFSFLLWMPIFYDYQRQMGLNDHQIFNIQSWYYFSFCLLEFPTGFIADRFGHKNCMLTGSVLNGIANLIPVFFVGYPGFLSHWLLLALARSLISGASSAYLYNYLEDLGQTELYKDAEGRARAYSLLAKVIGFALVGPLMHIALSLPYSLSALASVLAALSVLWMPAAIERATVRPVKPRPAQVVRLVLHNPILPLLMLQGVGIFTLTRILQVNLFQPILQSKGFERTGFGIILSLNTLFEALGAAFPQLLQRWMGDLMAVFWLTLGLALCCYAAAPAGPIGAVVALTLFALLAGLAYPIQRKLLNAAIPDSGYRASLLSVESLVDRFVCALVAHQVGGYAAAGHINQFLQGSAAVCALVNLALLMLISGARKCRIRS